MFKKTSILLCLFLTCFACSDPMETSMFTDNFDRAEMLEFWADDIIIPAFQSYAENLDGLDQAASSFFTDATATNLEGFRSAWLAAYLAWQEVSLFDIGKAEELGLRNFTNIYPTNTDLILSNISSQDLNLELPSNFSAQGFPALDYMLFGIEEDDALILARLTEENVVQYVQTLIDRLIDLNASVLLDWEENFRDEFIANAGSSATASTDKMVNDFLFYYERFVRASKVGIPAGIFSGSTEAELVEARYADIYSKELFERSFLSVKNFFRGISFDRTQEGNSLEDYLDHIRATNGLELDLANSIISQWDSVDSALTELSPSFANQVTTDNTKMLALYDEMQKAVPLLKVDMLSALNIQVDFVDADGD